MGKKSKQTEPENGVDMSNASSILIAKSAEIDPTLASLFAASASDFFLNI